MNRRSAVGGTLALATGFVLLAFVAWSANADRLLERLPRAVERAEHGVGARLRAAGIVAYWDFDGTRPRDRISGEGVLTGGTRIVAGREGSARRFVPKEEAFIRTTLPLTALGERFTFSCWLKFPEEVPNQQVFQYLIVKDGKLVLRLPGQKTCEWPLEIRGRFFHAAFTVDQGAGRAALFVDGEKKGELDLAPVRHNAMPLCFGQDRWMPPAAFSLDEASLWDRALSEQEIRKLSRLRWSLAADRAAARLALLRGASALRNGHAALLLAADLFNPFLHESRVLAAGLPSYALALSRNDERHFTQYFNEIVGNGLNAQGTSEKRTVELLDDGQKRTAVMELVSASQIGPESSAKQSFTLEVLAADGTTERKVLLRPIEGTSYLLEMLAAQLGRESGIRGVFSELSVVTINGTLQGIYLAEDLLQDKGPFWRGEADQWQSLLRRVPVFRGEVLAQFDRLAEQLAGALESERKSPLTSREIRRELLRQRELLGEAIADRTSRSDEALVARVADHVREDLFLGDNPHPDLIVGDLVLPPATLNGATLSFASLTPELLTDAGRLTSPAAQGARAGLRVTITSGAARREKDLSFGVLPGGRRLPVLRVEAAGTPRKDSTVPCLAELVEAGDARSGLLEGRLRLRGNSVLVKNKGRKVYYRIELARPRDVFGAGPTKVLLLTSAWRDVSLMRDRLCYDLFRGFSEPGRPRYSPHARYVELVVNGDYQGVYLLTDRIDADLLGFGKKSGRGAEHAVLYKAKDDRASFSELHEEAYVQKAPDWRDGEDWGPLAQLVGFVGQTPPKAFAAGIEGLVDVDEIIDFETLLLLRADREGRNYNLYVGRPPGPGARFFVVPWDCDMSFYHTDGASNALIHRLHQALPGYSRRANERWQALRRDRLSEKGLMARIDGLEAELAGAAGRNYRRWPLLPGWSWEGDVQTLREFLKTRLVTLDKVFQDAEDAAAARGM